MASDFKYIIFSIFDISDFNKVTDVVKLIFKRELEKGKAYISYMPSYRGIYKSPKWWFTFP